MHLDPIRSLGHSALLLYMVLWLEGPRACPLADLARKIGGRENSENAAVGVVRLAAGTLEEKGILKRERRRTARGHADGAGTPYVWTLAPGLMDKVARAGVARLMYEASLAPKLKAVLLRLFLHGGTAIGTMAELASLLGVHRTRLARVIEAIELSGCVRVEQAEPSGRSKRLRLEIVDEEATQTVSPEPPGGASSAMPEAARSSEDPPAPEPEPEPEPEDNPVGLVGESQAEMEALLDQVRDRELLERVMHCAEGSLPLGERLGIRRRVKDWIRPVIEQQEREDATQENLELAINKALLQTLRQIDSPPKRSDGSPKWKNWFPKAVDGHLEPYERSWESNADVDPAYRREE